MRTEYTTAAKRAAAADADAPDDPGLEPIKFTYDGREVTAYPPKQGAMMMMMAALRGEIDAQVATMVDFTLNLFDEEDRDYFTRRLMDRNDPLEWDDLEGVVTDLMHEWFGRPTEPSSASKPSPRNDGPKSTAKRRSKATA